MKKITKINRKALTAGVCKLLEEQGREAKRLKKLEIEKELQTDERVLVLQALKEVHPSIAEELERTILSLICNETAERTAHIQTYFGYGEDSKIRAKLELLTDEQIYSYTLEELASIVKP